MGDAYQELHGQSSCRSCPEHTQRYVGLLTGANKSSCQCVPGAPHNTIALVWWSCHLSSSVTPQATSRRRARRERCALLFVVHHSSGVFALGPNLFGRRVRSVLPSRFSDSFIPPLCAAPDMHLEDPSRLLRAQDSACASASIWSHSCQQRNCARRERPQLHAMHSAFSATCMGH